MPVHPALARYAPPLPRTCARGLLLHRFSLIVLAGLCAAPAPWQAPSPCDSTVVAATRDPLAYGRRGERCEGVYVQQVAGSSSLHVLSFTEPVAAFDIQGGDRLRLEWAGVGKAPVRLRATALRPRVYYRMDAERPSGVTSFDWPADVVGALKLRSQQIGIVAVMSYPVGGKTEEVYVPVRLGKASVAPSHQYVVSLRPMMELSEIFVTLAEADASGKATRTIKQDERLGYGYYPAENPIAVTLPRLERTGLYRLQFGATLKRGGSTTKELLFLHAGG